MKLTPPFHTEDGSVVDAFGEYVGTLDPNTAHQALFLLNRPEAKKEDETAYDQGIRIGEARSHAGRIAAALEKITERMPSKRERLVTAVLAGLCSNEERFRSSQDEVNWAVEIADNTIAELEKDRK